MEIKQDLVITAKNAGEFQRITKCQRLQIESGVEFSAPLLATSGNIYLRENAKLDAPLLATSGNIDLSENAKLDAPLLATSGNIYLSENAKLVTRKTKKLNYKSVDNTFFVIEGEHSTKGIKILTGYVLVKFTDGKPEKKSCYVAEKGEFKAHGESVKKAITDLQFKIVSEKLKKDPIKPDTEFTVKYYRLITGACDSGVRNWMERNGIAFDVLNPGTDEEETIEKAPMKAKELLPILENTNAYGIEKFKSLVTF